MTVWQGNAALAPGLTASVASGTQRLALLAALKMELKLTTTPESLFDLLQNLMDAEQWDPATRDQALIALLVYHAATSSNDKATSARRIDRIRKDAQLMLSYVWGVYSSGVYGIYGMPVDSPKAAQLSEVAKQIATTRTSLGLTPLPVTI